MIKAGLNGQRWMFLDETEVLLAPALFAQSPTSARTVVHADEFIAAARPVLEASFDPALSILLQEIEASGNIRSLTVSIERTQD